MFAFSFFLSPRLVVVFIGLLGTALYFAHIAIFSVELSSSSSSSFFFFFV